MTCLYSLYLEDVHVVILFQTYSPPFHILAYLVFAYIGIVVLN